MIEHLDIFDLEGKRAVITGGAGVLGSAIAAGLGRAGAETAICDIVDIRKPVQRLRKNGINAQNRYLLFDKKGKLTPRGNSIIGHTPMGRFGNPEDLIGVCIWLASDASKFVTGTVIPIDGGFSAFSGV